MTKLIMAFMILWMAIATYALYWMVDGMMAFKDDRNEIRAFTAQLATDFLKHKGNNH